MAILDRRSLEAVVVALVLMAEGELAQNTCAAKLITCQPYLGSAKPPETCCGPLKQAVQEQLSCLCALFNNPAIFREFNISLQQALALPVHCGIENTNACSAPSPGASNTPPATPGGDSGHGHRMAWIGMSGLTSLFLVLWSILA